ncbi:uncharacterized protein LOC144443060 [Glandiceps talaboti]
MNSIESPVGSGEGWKGGGINKEKGAGNTDVEPTISQSHPVQKASMSRTQIQPTLRIQQSESIDIHDKKDGSVTNPSSVWVLSSSAHLAKKTTFVPSASIQLHPTLGTQDKANGSKTRTRTYESSGVTTSVHTTVQLSTIPSDQNHSLQTKKEVKQTAISTAAELLPSQVTSRWTESQISGKIPIKEIPSSRIIPTTLQTNLVITPQLFATRTAKGIKPHLGSRENVDVTQQLSTDFGTQSKVILPTRTEITPTPSIQVPDKSAKVLQTISSETIGFSQHKQVTKPSSAILDSIISTSAQDVMLITRTEITPTPSIHVPDKSAKEVVQVITSENIRNTFHVTPSNVHIPKEPKVVLNTHATLITSPTPEVSNIQIHLKSHHQSETFSNIGPSVVMETLSSISAGETGVYNPTKSIGSKHQHVIIATGVELTSSVLVGVSTVMVHVPKDKLVPSLKSMDISSENIALLPTPIISEMPSLASSKNEIVKTLPLPSFPSLNSYSSSINAVAETVTMVPVIVQTTVTSDKESVVGKEPKQSKEKVQSTTSIHSTIKPSHQTKQVLKSANPQPTPSVVTVTKGKKSKAVSSKSSSHVTSPVQSEIVITSPSQFLASSSMNKQKTSPTAVLQPSEVISNSKVKSSVMTSVVIFSTISPSASSSGIVTLSTQPSSRSTTESSIVTEPGVHVQTKPQPTKPPKYKPTSNTKAKPKGTTFKPTVTEKKPPPVKPTKPSYPEIYIKLIMAMTWPEFCPVREDFKNRLVRIAEGVSNLKAKFNVVLLNDDRYCNGSGSNVEGQRSERSSEIYIDLYFTMKDVYDKTLTIQVGYAIEDNNFDLGSYGNQLLQASINGDVRPTTDQPAKRNKPPHFIGWTIGVGVVGLCLLFCIFSGVHRVRRRRRRVKQKEMQVMYGSGAESLVVSCNDYDKDTVLLTPMVVQNGNSKASKRISRSILAAVNYAMELDEAPSPQVLPSHSLTVDALSKFYTYTEAIEEEFASLPNKVIKSSEIPPGVEKKNRYSHALPPSNSRVQLTYRIGEDNSEYINANFVKGYDYQRKAYIATQAPMENTVNDFWRMVWEQQSQVILMLTDIKESKLKKCFQYWPSVKESRESTHIHGDHLISVQSIDEKEYCTITTLMVKDIDKNLCRTLTHHWFKAWPHNTVPDDPESVVSFLLDARQSIHEHHGPVIIHCSPGTGRTGTVIAIDIGMRSLEDNKAVDVPNTVSCIRQDRAGAVQTKEQYNFIYQALQYYATRLVQQLQQMHHDFFITDVDELDDWASFTSEERGPI